MDAGASRRIERQAPRPSEGPQFAGSTEARSGAGPAQGSVAGVIGHQGGAVEGGHIYLAAYLLRGGFISPLRCEAVIHERRRRLCVRVSIACYEHIPTGCVLRAIASSRPRT